MYVEIAKTDSPWAQQLLRAVKAAGVSQMAKAGNMELSLLVNDPRWSERRVEQLRREMHATQRREKDFHRPYGDLLQALHEGINAVLLCRQDNELYIECSEHAGMFYEVINDLEEAGRLMSGVRFKLNTFERTGDLHERPSYSR